MKKIILSMFALIAMGEGTAWAGDKPVITVADVEALAGETVSFAVSLTDGKADTYTAMTLYAYFPTTGFTTTDNYEVADAWPGTMCTVGDVKENGLATIPFASSNKIAGSAVENLVTVSFTVDESVSLGEYEVTLKQTLFEYNNSDKDYADDVTFKVKVVSAHSVTLDENATTTPEVAEGVNVRVKRTIAAGEWGTIVLPFAMTEEQVKTAFGDDAQLGDFTGCETTEDEDGDIVGIKVNFAAVNAIEANHPYIIKVTSPVTEFTADGVDIAPEEQPSTDCDRIGKGTKKDPYLYNSFVGTYTAGFSLATLLDKGSYPLFLSGGQFWYAGSATQPMKAFRAYFDFYDVLTSVENAQARIKMTFLDEGGLTGIDDPKSQTSNLNPIFDLQGRRVAHPGRGLYIRGGKVVNIK